MRFKTVKYITKAYPEPQSTSSDVQGYLAAILQTRILEMYRSSRRSHSAIANSKPPSYHPNRGDLGRDIVGVGYLWPLNRDKTHA